MTNNRRCLLKSFGLNKCFSIVMCAFWFLCSCELILHFGVPELAFSEWFWAYDFVWALSWCIGCSWIICVMLNFDCGTYLSHIILSLVISFSILCFLSVLIDTMVCSLWLAFLLVCESYQVFEGISKLYSWYIYCLINGCPEELELVQLPFLCSHTAPLSYCII
jgi:hypothetical protein